jgi:hypothetical protein
MDWTTDVNLGGFGSGAEMQWKTVKSWETFTKFFSEAIHIDAVTYCESPDLLLDLFEKHAENLETMDVLVGNREEYQSAVNEVSIARRLEDYCREEKLVIRLKNQRVVHSKLYRIVKEDETVSLIVGSANLSHNSWRNQTNSVAVFHTAVDSQLDQQFQAWIADHRDTYANEIFMEDLVEKLEAIDDPEEEERQIELWIDNRDTELTEQGEIHSTVGNELEQLGEDVDKVVGVTDDPDEADEIVSVQYEQIEPESQETDTANTESQADSLDTAGRANNLDGSDRSSGSPTGVAAARTPDYQITLSTQGFETDGYLDDMETDLKRRGADVGSDAITTPVEGYANYLKTRYDVPKMWINEERSRVHLQHGERHRILTASEEPTPETLDHCLENIEEYIKTVERWGETNNERAVMAHMYEGILYGLWAPFVNLYAQQFYGSVTLDNALQYLYIFGESDAGKDKFTEFVLRLLSDELVRGSADADNVGKTQIRSLRNIDTIFPYVISDISKQKIERIETLRNFWEDSWTPDKDVAYPTLIFTSNDSRPNDWFRNRAKMLHFDVAFPSNPEDKGFYKAQEDLNQLLDTKNTVFAFVSRRILREERYKEASGTVDDVREIFLEFYDQADRNVPKFFPKDPANREYNIGKRKWRQARDRGDVTFERRDNHLIASFELEPHELYSFRKTLPTKMRPEKSGRNIIIKNPDDFTDWLESDDAEEEPQSSGGILSRLLG